MGGCRRSQLLFLAISAVLLMVAPFSTAIGQAAGEGKPQKEGWRRVESAGSRTSGDATKITVVGNSALVPVTLLYKSSEVDVLLLLDTGSSRTVVSAETADRLNINLAEARKLRLQVVGGAIIEARQARLSSITIGPHTKRNADILIVDHKGPPVKHDGLLGMDLLRGLKYNVELEERIIRWE